MCIDDNIDKDFVFFNQEKQEMKLKSLKDQRELKKVETGIIVNTTEDDAR